MSKLPLTLLLSLMMVTTVGLLSGCILSAATPHEPNIFEYVYHDSEDDEKIHDALIKLNLNNEELGDFELVKAIIASSGWDKSNEYHHFYLALVPEGVTSGLMCSWVRVDYLMPIFTMYDLKPFRAFFRDYWGGIFKQCAVKDLARIEAMIRRPDHSQNLIQLDRFFKAALGFDGNVNYDEYYNKLNGLNLATVEGLNVHAMLRFIRRPSGARTREKFIERTMIRLQDFIKKGLNPLFYTDLRGPFSVINMARILQNSPVLTRKQLILNEYHRISVAWRNPWKLKRILANIRKQIEATEVLFDSNAG